jgi:hypothetical protein
MQTKFSWFYKSKCFNKICGFYYGLVSPPGRPTVSRPKIRPWVLRSVSYCFLSHLTMLYKLHAVPQKREDKTVNQDTPTSTVWSENIGNILERLLPVLLVHWCSMFPWMNSRMIRSISSTHYYTILQAGRSQVLFPMRSLDFFNLPNPSSRTQPLTEMGTRNLPGGKGRPARKADNFTAICKPIV